MQFTIFINQARSVEWGLDLTLSCLFAFLYQVPSWARPEADMPGYYFISKGKVARELPILTDKPDTIYRQMKRLEEKGLIEMSSRGPRTLIRITDLGKTWNKEPDLGSQSELTSDHSPSNLGSQSEPTSDLRPTDQVTKRSSNQSGNQGSGEGAPAPPKPKKRAAQISDDFEPTDTHRRIASEEGVDLERERSKFVDHFAAKGEAKKDWDRAFNNWLRRAGEYGGNKKQNPNGTYDGRPPEFPDATPDYSEGVTNDGRLA